MCACGFCLFDCLLLLLLVLFVCFWLFFLLFFFWGGVEFEDKWGGVEVGRGGWGGGGGSNVCVCSQNYCIEIIFLEDLLSRIKWESVY